MSDQQKPHSFLNGLVIGFLAGAASYFLLKTEEGRSLKHSFKQKWSQTKQDLPQLTEIKLGDVTLEEILDVVLTDKPATDLAQSENNQPLLKQVSLTKKTKKKPEKFTGIDL